MKQNNVSIILELIIIEVIFFIFWFYMYGSFFTNHIIVFGDVGMPYLNAQAINGLFSNSGTFSSFSSVFILVYQLYPKIFPMLWDFYLFFIPALTPLGFYYLAYSMNVNRSSRFVSTLFYTLNPLTMIFGIGGLEYTGIFLFFPLILAFQIKYFESKNLNDVLISFLLMFLLFIFLGVDYLKFIVFIFLAISILEIFLSGKKYILKNIKNYFYGFILILLLSIPLIISEVNALIIFHRSVITNVTTVQSLLGITKFEFANSNILTSLYGLPYVANQLTSINYESSWYSVLYIFLILFGLISVIVYKGKYKYINYALFSVLLFLILFQYGVYNGTLIALYRYSIVDIYNYPLFFYISQLLIYAVFLSISLELIAQYIKIKNLKIKGKKASKPLLYIISIIFVIIIIVSSVPIMDYEHTTNPKNVISEEVPDYVLNLTNELKPYSNSRVLVLPDNTSSLNYIYPGVSYYDVYGFPYGYTNFISLYPNITKYSELGNAFQQNDIDQISEILELESIGTIVVLHTLSNNPISFKGTSINGGGKIFDELLNATGLYKLVVWNRNYAIYVFDAQKSNDITTPNGFEYYNYLQYNSSNSPVITSQFSFIQYPINITLNVAKNSGFSNVMISINRSDIESINQNFSNLLFVYENGTRIPAWIQSINGESAHIYLNLSDMTNKVYLRVYPTDSNEMSTGYLGEAPQLSGEGATVLPSNIIYSDAVVGVYGYGYDGSIFTLNCTFNKAPFSNILSPNLQNLAFYTYNGVLIPAKIISNTSSSFEVMLNFTPFGGVPYFQMDKSNSTSSSGNSYNVFYMGFAATNDNLNALDSSITFNTSSAQTAMNIQYFPFAVKDFGNYNAYDNAKLVFPYFTSFINGFKFANAWELAIPVSGYGLLVGGVYSPDVYYINNLYNLTIGQEATTYAMITSGPTASPIFVSNTTHSALLGSENTFLSTVGENKTLQDHSVDIGFGSNGSSNIGVYYDYNNTTAYAQDELYSTNISGFNNYSIAYDNGLTFYINNNNVSYYDYTSGILKLGISNINYGGMVSLYSFVTNNIDFNYTIGNASYYQAYLGNKQLQNPAYVGSTVTFTFVNSGNGNETVKWDVNNETLYGRSINYKFNNPGKYEINVSCEGKAYIYIENILQSPKSALENAYYTSIGNHEVSVNNTSGIYEWFVNGIKINESSYSLKYNFKYYEAYAIKVFIFNSLGNYSESFIIDIIHINNLRPVDYLYILYYGLLPLVIIIYITSSRFRSFLNKEFVAFLKLSGKIKK
ncbi:MAG: hypothetical protein QXU98_01535 [Candidatus Parvarchaeota archaeon]